MTRVVAAGDLTLIQNDELRQALSDWQRRIVLADQNLEQDYDWFYGAWMPFMRAHGNLPQVSNAIEHIPGSTEPAYTEPVPIGEKTNHLPLLENQAFVNVVLQRRWVNEDALFQYEQLRPRLEAVTQMLEEGLRR